MNDYAFLVFKIVAGIPDTTEYGGTSFTTTELGATIELSPIVTFPITLHPVANSTLFPIHGISSAFLQPHKQPTLTTQ